MRKLVWGVLFLTLLPLAMMGDDTPKAELFGGYSYYRASGGSNLNGWNAAIAGNINDWLGLVGDFSGHYGSFHQQSYLFGPQISFRKLPMVTPFVHSLFGGAHIDVTSQNSFAMALGGGVDVKVGPHMAVRAVQLDYVRTGFFGNGQNNTRLSLGVVLRF